MLRRRAFSLIEYLIYIAMLSILSMAVVSLIIQFIGLERKVSALQEIQDNGRIVMDTLGQEIKQAKSIYTPTSRLGSNPGQLSLETTNYASAGDTTTYVDFYIDGQQLYLKRQGQAATRLTSPNIQVQNLVITSLNQATTPALRISLTLTSPRLPSSTYPFISTISLRPQL